MSRRLMAWVTASALVAAGLAVPAPANARPAPKAAGPYHFQHLYPELGSPHAAHPVLGPSRRGAVRLAAPGTVGMVALGHVPAFAPMGASAAARVKGRAVAAPAVSSVPVGIGPVRNATFLTYKLADYLELKVNVGSGDAMVRTTDMSLPETSGNLTVGAAYNSLLQAASVPTGIISPGWTTRQGQDVRLYKNSDSSVTYAGPDGVSGVFTVSGSSYTTPKEFKGTLSSQSGGGWEYLDHGSGQQSYFDSTGLPTKLVDRNGNTTVYSYSGGDLSKITFEPKGTTTGRSITVSDYSGPLSSYAESDGKGTTRQAVYSYDGSNRLIDIQEPAGEIAQFGYDSSGNLASIENGKGIFTDLSYDSNHRVLAVTQVGQSGNQVTRLAYPSGTETQEADPDTDQSQPVSAVPNTTYTIDSSSDRVTQTVDAQGNKRSKAYTPFFDVASATGANGGVTTNTFGANSGESATKSASPTGTSASLTYGNAPTSQNPTAAYQPSAGTDTQGNASTYTYDGAGNQASSKNALAAQAKVDYNTDGTVKDSTDPSNGTNSTTYAYDTNHQLVSITPPTGNTLKKKTFTYDGFGRLATVTDGNGKKTSYTYDLDDRVLTVSYSDGTPTVTYTYDMAGNVSTRADASGTTTWTYSYRNLVAAREATSGGGEIDYQYDPTGNLINLADGRGSDHYIHNTRNLLASMTDATGKQWIFKYDGDGRRTDTYFNYNSTGPAWSMHSVTYYDKSGRVTEIETTGTSTSNPVISDLTYCYSKYVSGSACSTASSTDTGLRQWSENNVTNKISVDTYDAGNRLTKATAVDGHDYGYGYDSSPSNGNRTTVSVDGTNTQTLTYNSANQITSSGYGYDASGNQTASPTVTQMTYNAAEQMTQTKVGGTTTSYTYAGPDQSELVKTGTTSIVYGLNGTDSYVTGTSTVYIERDDSGTPLGTDVAGTESAYATDGLGSVVAVVSSAGTATSNYTYTPSGQQSGKASGDTNLLGYTGGFTDPATSNLYLSHRYYAPTQGSFTQQDTITKLADPESGNLYAYAGDDPANNIDPNGSDFFNLSVSGCFVLCVHGGVDFGDGGVRPEGGIGVGPDVSLDASFMGSSGESESGLTGGGDCEAGPAEGAVDLSDSSATYSAGVTSGADAGCEIDATYTG